jgi:hypothetical protein
LTAFIQRSAATSPSSLRPFSRTAFRRQTHRRITPNSGCHYCQFARSSSPAKRKTPTRRPSSNVIFSPAKPLRRSARLESLTEPRHAESKCAKSLRELTRRIKE